MIGAIAAVFTAMIFTASGFTAQDTLDAIEQAHTSTGVPYEALYRRVSCETGGTFDPYSQGDGGHSHGPVQLNDYGALPAFYAAGYTDPYNPYQSVQFMAEALSGVYPALGAHTWTCR